MNTKKLILLFCEGIIYLIIIGFFVLIAYAFITTSFAGALAILVAFIGLSLLFFAMTSI